MHTSIEAGNITRGTIAKTRMPKAPELDAGPPMRILFVSQYFPPEPCAPAARVSEIARAWARRGHDVTVLTAFPHHPTGIIPPEYRGRALAVERVDDVRVIRTWTYAAANRGHLRRSVGYGSFSASATVWGQLHAPRPDVVIATSPQLLCGAAGSVIARLRRVPFIFEVRDLWPESIVAVGSLRAEHPLIRALEIVESTIYYSAKAIVLVTHASRDKLATRGIAPEKLHVIPNGVDLKRFVPAPRETALRAKLGWNDKFVAAYVGTHGMAHGLDAVLDAAKELRARGDVRILFVGEGAERLRLQTRAEVENIDNVRFLGALPRDAMNEVYATADVCLVPLRKTELFTTVIPSKIFEIAAMNRPILLSVDGEARRIVETAGCGMFTPPGDSRGMASALADLADHPERARTMGNLGRAYVTEAYDRDALAERYLHVIRRVVRS